MHQKRSNSSLFSVSSGMLLHTSIMTPKDQPIKAVVCFCHGYTDSPSHTRRRELARLVQQGIAAVMIDYEGHGRSDGTLALVLDWDRLVDDIGTYFAHVAKTVFPEQNMFLMGEVRYA
jgi:alpha-beta hydrolase superfamily lysophospholipase